MSRPAVTEEMLDAAIDAYDVRGWGQHLWTPREAMLRAIEAAMRARRPDLRLVPSPVPSIQSKESDR